MDNKVIPNLRVIEDDKELNKLLADIQDYDILLELADSERLVLFDDSNIPYYSTENMNDLRIVKKHKYNSQNSVYYSYHESIEESINEVKTTFPREKLISDIIGYNSINIFEHKLFNLIKKIKNGEETEAEKNNRHHVCEIAAKWWGNKLRTQCPKQSPKINIPKSPINKSFQTILYEDKFDCEAYVGKIPEEIVEEFEKCVIDYLLNDLPKKVNSTIILNLYQFTKICKKMKRYNWNIIKYLLPTKKSMKFNYFCIIADNEQLKIS
jgi:hypothetical protein